MLDVFFPITPLPRELRFHHRSALGDQQLQVDASQVPWACLAPVSGGPAGRSNPGADQLETCATQSSRL
jgi:hypothetical protein